MFIWNYSATAREPWINLKFVNKEIFVDESKTDVKSMINDKEVFREKFTSKKFSNLKVSTYFACP